MLNLNCAMELQKCFEDAKLKSLISGQLNITCPVSLLYHERDTLEIN